MNFFTYWELSRNNDGVERKFMVRKSCDIILGFPTFRNQQIIPRNDWNNPQKQIMFFINFISTEMNISCYGYSLDSVQENIDENLFVC